MLSLQLLYELLLSTYNIAVVASPAQSPISIGRGPTRYFDIQAHRGGRGDTVENVLPSFAWGLIHGATTLELDNGITKDGHVVVWHDKVISARKCRDTIAVSEDDHDYPYIGKLIANLTLAQLKTLDCGSSRQPDYPMQLTYPNTRISTLQEVFDFVGCVDPTHQVLWNIESKIDPVNSERTRSVHDFVEKQHAVFANIPYRNAITYQSFDWKTLIEMKKLDPSITTSALIDDETAEEPSDRPSPWLAGLRLDSFNGSTYGTRIVQAAHFIGADIVSPDNSFPVANATRYVAAEGGVGSATWDIVRDAKTLGLSVKPWTVNNLDTVDTLVGWGVDGIITDYPSVVRRWAKQRGLPVAPSFPKQRVFACLDDHMRRNVGH